MSNWVNCSLQSIWKDFIKVISLVWHWPYYSFCLNSSTGYITFNFFAHPSNVLFLFVYEYGLIKIFICSIWIVSHFWNEEGTKNLTMDESVPMQLEICKPWVVQLDDFRLYLFSLPPVARGLRAGNNNKNSDKNGNIYI